MSPVKNQSKTQLIINKKISISLIDHHANHDSIRYYQIKWAEIFCRRQKYGIFAHPYYFLKRVNILM